MDEQLWLSETVSAETMLRWAGGINGDGDNVSTGYDTISEWCKRPLVTGDRLMRILEATAGSFGNDPQNSDHIRCILGNPWRNPYCLCDDTNYICDWCCRREHLLKWNNGAIRSLAETIYDDNSYELLPILADALEEAGFDNKDLIGHCRGWQRCYSCLGLGEEEKTVRIEKPTTELYKTKVVRIPCHLQQEPYYELSQNSTSWSLITVHKKCVNGWKRFHTPHVKGCHVIELLLGRY